MPTNKPEPDAQALPGHVASTDLLGPMVPERDKPCPHCGSVACANGGGNMSGYWIIHSGCDKARAAREKPHGHVSEHLMCHWYGANDDKP